MNEDTLQSLVDAVIAAASSRTLPVIIEPPNLTKRVYRRDAIAGQMAHRESDSIEIGSSMRTLSAGPYSFIFAELDGGVLGAVDRIEDVRMAAAIARSWLGPVHEVDLCIVLVGPAGSNADPEWRSLAHSLERDELICRKLVWLPPARAEELAASVGRFVRRTPLASPWNFAAQATEQNLDVTSFLLHSLGPAFQADCELPIDLLREWLMLLEQETAGQHLAQRLIDLADREHVND